MPLVLVQPGVIKKNSAEYFAGMCSFFFFRNEETENFAPRRLVVSSHKYKYIKTTHKKKQYAVSEVSSPVV